MAYVLRIQILYMGAVVVPIMEIPIYFNMHSLRGDTHGELNACYSDDNRALVASRLFFRTGATSFSLPHLLKMMSVPAIKQLSYFLDDWRNLGEW